MRLSTKKGAASDHGDGDGDGDGDNDGDNDGVNDGVNSPLYHFVTSTSTNDLHQVDI